MHGSPTLKVSSEVHYLMDSLPMRKKRQIDIHLNCTRYKKDVKAIKSLPTAQKIRSPVQHCHFISEDRQASDKSLNPQKNLGRVLGHYLSYKELLEQ
ncbi:hypothetical protein Mapa_013438 [Marchantia paleacea]|nr:hypothetical protein Mapa_013438 [Marchantia paleacea]